MHFDSIISNPENACNICNDSCKLKERHETCFNNLLVRNAMEAQFKFDYWKARKAFCVSQCGETCPLLSDDIEGGGGTVVNCEKFHKFINELNKLKKYNNNA